jgi:enoyl-CoA hydratase
VYTGEKVSAQELFRYGSIYAVVQRTDFKEAVFALAKAIAEKSPTVIRAAKACLNGIDPVDVNRSYRFEQGFTFELNLSGVADEARDAFVAKEEPEFSK